MHRFPRWTAAAAAAAGDGTDREAVALGEGGEGLCRAAVEGAADGVPGRRPDAARSGHRTTNVQLPPLPLLPRPPPPLPPPPRTRGSLEAAAGRTTALGTEAPPGAEVRAENFPSQPFMH